MKAIRSISVAGKRSFRLCGSRLDRQTGFLPGGPAADQGARSAVSSLSEFLRHTGAGRFVRSGTVGDEPRLPFQTKFPGAFGHMVRRHTHCSLRLGFVPFEAALGAYVEERDRLL